MEKYLKILELDKIVNKIKEKVVLDQNKIMLEEMTLINDIEEIETALNEVYEASSLIQRMQRFPLYFKGDIVLIIT
jgi:dsDNA-specific endonuclease/ATPase MutS2